MPRQMIQVGRLASGMSGNLAAPIVAAALAPACEEAGSIASAILHSGGLGVKHKT